MLLQSILDTCGNEPAQFSLELFLELITSLLSSDELVNTLPLSWVGWNTCFTCLWTTESCQELPNSMMKLQRQLTEHPRLLLLLIRPTTKIPAAWTQIMLQSARY